MGLSDPSGILCASTAYPRRVSTEDSDRNVPGICQKSGGPWIFEMPSAGVVPTPMAHPFLVGDKVGTMS